MRFKEQIKKAARAAKINLEEPVRVQFLYGEPHPVVNMFLKSEILNYNNLHEALNDCGKKNATVTNIFVEMNGRTSRTIRINEGGLVIIEDRC